MAADMAVAALPPEAAAPVPLESQSARAPMPENVAAAPYADAAPTLRAASAGPVEPSESSMSGSGDRDGDVSAGVVIGAVLGAVALAATIAALAIALALRWRRQQRQKATASGIGIGARPARIGFIQSLVGIGVSTLLEGATAVAELSR